MSFHVPAHKNTRNPAGQVPGSQDRASTPSRQIYESRTCSVFTRFPIGDSLDSISTRWDAAFDCIDAPAYIPAGYTRRSMFADDAVALGINPRIVHEPRVDRD